MSRKTKKLRINKKKGNKKINKKKDARRTRKIYGGVTLNKSLQPGDTLYKYNPVPYNESFNVKILGVASNITGNKNVADKKNPDIWYLVAFKNGVYKKEISGHTLEPSKDWLTSWSIAPETYNQNSIDAISDFFGTGNTIRKLYKTEDTDIDTDSKIQFINTVIKNGSDGYLSETLDTIVRRLEAKRDLEVEQFIAEPKPNPFDENDEESSPADEESSLLQDKIDEDEKKRLEAKDDGIDEGNSKKNAASVSRFSKFSSQIKLPGQIKLPSISFPSIKNTLKRRTEDLKTSNSDIENTVRELETENSEIENKVRELRNALMLPLPKEPQIKTIVETDEKEEIDGGAKNDKESDPITSIKEIIANTPGVLSDTNITKIEDLLKDVTGDSFKEQVDIINEIVSESKKYNTNTVQIETLAKAIAKPTSVSGSKPKSSGDIEKGQTDEREIAIKSRKARLIKDINQILKDGEIELNITDFIQEGKPEGKDRFTEEIGEKSDSRLERLVESLDALVNPKPSIATTDGPLKLEPGTAPSSGIFNKFKNFTRKKSPLATTASSSLEDHVVLASSFVTLANALIPATDTTVQVPEGSSGRSVEKDLIEAIEKIIADDSCFADEKTGSFYSQLELYKKTYANLTVEDIRKLGELEPGLRKRILECNVETKKAAQIVLADYEKRSSALLSTKDRLFNRFTRKNSGKDAEISDILDRVKDVSGDELETIISKLRDALSKPDDTQARFNELDKLITQYKTLLTKNQKELSEAAEDAEKADIQKRISQGEKNIADKTKEKDNVKSTVEENVDLILDWLKSTRQDAEGAIKAKQIELRKGKSPGEQAVIKDDVKRLTDRIAILKKNERDVFSIKGLKNIKTANNRTFKQRLFGDKERDTKVSETSDSGEKLGFNNKPGDIVINAFEIKDGRIEEFVPIVIEGDEIYIDNIRIDGSEEAKRQVWNEARKNILGLKPQKGNALPSFDAGKLTFKVYKRGKVSIQLNDGPVVYINNKDELEKFKNDSRKPTQKPYLLSRISNPFKNMFGIREPTVPRTPPSVEEGGDEDEIDGEDEDQDEEDQDQEEGGVEGLSEEGEHKEEGEIKQNGPVRL